MKGKGDKVLIVEDDLLISMLEQRMLSNLGFDIIETVAGKADYWNNLILATPPLP